MYRSHSENIVLYDQKKTKGRFFVCQSPITVGKATFIGMMFVPGKQ